MTCQQKPRALNIFTMCQWIPAIMISTKQMSGISFDGEHAYQYVDGEKTQINEFPFDQYDSYAEKILELSKTILTHKY